METRDMNIDPNARYTKTHEWIRPEDDVYAYGITDHAQNALSDIVFVDLPAIGERFSTGDTVGVVESVKAASDLYMPVAGEVVAVNESLTDAPEAVNADPYGSGWIIKFKMADPAEFTSMLTAEEYASLAGE
jgi:glycine cleavage system H protein